MSLPWNASYHITPVLKSTPYQNTPPLCQPCWLAWSNHYMPKVTHLTNTCHDQAGTLSQDAYKDGNFVSADQWIVNNSDRFLSGYGQVVSQNKFCSGTLFYAAATGCILVENQVSKGAGEILMAKELFEQCIGNSCCRYLSPSQWQQNLQCWPICCR